MTETRTGNSIRIDWMRLSKPELERAWARIAKRKREQADVRTLYGIERSNCEPDEVDLGDLSD